MRKITPIISAAITCLVSHAATTVTNSWNVDLLRNTPAVWSIWRGDTLTLAANLNVFGITNAVFYWQAPAMGSLWWEKDAEFTSNGTVSVVWSPAMDSGADTYTYFFRAGDVYRPRGTLLMQDSPGAAPNEIPLPIRALDFATIIWTNAPWLETEADPIAIPLISSLSNQLASTTLKSLAEVDDRIGSLQIVEPLVTNLVHGTFTVTNGLLGAALTFGYGYDDDPSVAARFWFAVDSGFEHYLWRNREYDWILTDALLIPNIPELAADEWVYAAGVLGGGEPNLVVPLGRGLLPLAMTFPKITWIPPAEPEYSPAATEEWVIVNRGFFKDTVTNMIWNVVVSNGHWLIKGKAE